MSYQVRISRSVARKLTAWSLPDFLLVEIYLRLNDEVARRPTELLQRAHRPFDGMIYRFRLIDPADRLVEHVCTFQILFSQDEETLHVVNFRYFRRSG